MRLAKAEPTEVMQGRGIQREDGTDGSSVGFGAGNGCDHTEATWVGGYARRSNPNTVRGGRCERRQDHDGRTGSHDAPTMAVLAMKHRFTQGFLDSARPHGYSDRALEVLDDALAVTIEKVDVEGESGYNTFLSVLLGEVRWRKMGLQVEDAEQVEALQLGLHPAVVADKHEAEQAAGQPCNLDPPCRFHADRAPFRGGWVSLGDVLRGSDIRSLRHQT